MTNLVQSCLRHLFSPRPAPIVKARPNYRLQMEVLEERLVPATRIWDGGAAIGADLRWSDRFNWEDNIAPVSGDHLVFPVASSTSYTTLNDFADGTFFRSITFRDDGYSLQGNRIVLGQGGIFVAQDTLSDNPTVIHLNFTLTAGLTQVNVEAGEVIEFRNVISGAAGGFIKRGDGAAIFSGDTNNTYRGATRVDAGGLFLGKIGATAIAGPLVIGNGVGADPDFVFLNEPEQIANTTIVTIRSTGVFEMAGQEESIGGLNMTGGTVNTGTLRLLGNVVTNASATPATITGGAGATVTLRGGPKVFNVANGTAAQDLIISSTIVGNDFFGTGAILIKNGGGTMMLTRDNTYTGNTIINAGTLVINGQHGPSPIIVNGGTLAGTGRVGSIIANRGAVSPGQSPGILETTSTAHRGSSSNSMVPRRARSSINSKPAPPCSCKTSRRSTCASASCRRLVRNSRS